MTILDIVKGDPDGLCVLKKTLVDEAGNPLASGWIVKCSSHPYGRDFYTEAEALACFDKENNQ